MPKISTDLRNRVIDGVLPSMSTCNIYSGTIPSTGDTSPTGTLLVSFSASLAWGTSASGTSDVTPVTSDAAAATGTAGYAMLTDGAGQNLYCSVATSGADLTISSTSIVSGGTVDITALSVTMPGS